MEHAPKLLIVYESSNPGLKEIAKRIEKACERLKFRIVCKCADDVIIPEVLASQAYFFGAQNSPSEDYRELERLFKGINLAGRRAGFFTLDSVKAVDYLRAITKDTDLTANPNPWSPGNPSIEEGLALWLRATLNS